MIKNNKKSIFNTVLMVVLSLLLITGCSSPSKEGTEKNNKDAKAAIGDTVIIDFTGYLDGKEFDGGSAKNYGVELGTNTFIDDFEEQIAGHKVEDEFDVNVTFPNTYGNEDLKGKDVTFKVKLHEIWRKIASDKN